MTLERSKKPFQVTLETGKPKQPQPNQTPIAKTPFAPMSAAQLQRARARFDRDTAALQRKVAPTDAATPTSQVPDQQAMPTLPAKQQAFHSSFNKSPAQRKALENIKNQSIQASSLRAQYQAAITPDIVQRLADERSTRQSQDARASQAPNALNARTDWFNSELPVLRTRHNNPDQAEFDTASVFNQSDARARDLGKTYVAQRVASGLTANDAASAIVNIGRKRDRNNALKGVLSAIRPQDSDYARIQRLVGEKEHDLELQRRATEEAVMPQATHLAREAANPSQANSGISEKIKAKIGGGSPLPEHVRSQLEAGLNSDLSKVRVHTDSEADTLAKSVNAIAFTSGQDIFFSSGKFEPNTKTGYELLAHEVTHTVQQAGGQVKPGIDSDPSLETAAQDTGAKLAAHFDPNVKSSKPKTDLASGAPTSNAGSSQAAVQRLSDTKQLEQTVPTTVGKPEQIPGAKPAQNLKIPLAPIPSEAKVVNEQKPTNKPSTPTKAPIKAKAPKPTFKPKTPKSARVKPGSHKLPAALVKKPVAPKANTLEFKADIKSTKTGSPTALKTNVNTRNIAFAPIPNLEKTDPSEKAKLLLQQADSTKAANATVQNLRNQAQSLEPHGAKLSAQITQAASVAKNLVSQAGEQQKALINTQISALIAQAKSKGQASIGKNNSDAKAKTGTLAGITNTAKQAITAAHQQQVQALKTKLEAQKTLIAAKYDANKGNYVTAGNTAGNEAKTVAAAKAETWRAGKTDESWWDKTKSYADFGAGPHPNDTADAKADADIQTGDGYAGSNGYPKIALEAFEKSKEGIEHDFENFKTYFHDPRLQALDNQKNNALSQLQNSEKSAKQQIEQTRAQMERAMKAQLDGVLQQLTGQKSSLSATIDAVIKQSTSGIDAQSSSQIKGVQTALKTAATGIQSGISQLEAQMSGKNAPKPEVLKKMLGQIEQSIASTVKQTLAQTSQSANASGKEFNSLAQTSITGMRSSTQQGIQTAKQSEQQLIQSLAQLVQSASSAYTKFQQTHKTSSTKTQADTIAEFTTILLSADPAFKAALEQLATNLENAATDYGKGLVAHANGPDFSREMTNAENEAKAKVQPRWKGLLKILLIIVVIVVIALVIGPAVIGAVGAFAATMGAGAAAGAIGAIVGGAIVGALSGAVIQMGSNAIDGKAIFEGVGQAMLVGAISGAIGGGLGYAFSSGANAAAASSRTMLSAIGNKANTFAGKMILDQVNGVVSSQFSSLLTTGKFQDFGDMLRDPSMWIGVGVSAASHAGGTRVGTNGEPVRPANKLEIIQERAFGAGENFGKGAGYKVGDVTGFGNVKVRTEVNPNIGPEGQRVGGFEEGKTKLEVGEGAHPNDVKIHEDVAKQVRKDNSPLNQAKERILGTERETPINSRKYELEFEAKKHEQMAAWREKAAADLPANDPQRAKLLNEAAQLRQKSETFKEAANSAEVRKQNGFGEIELVEKFDPSKSTSEYQNKAQERIDRLAAKGKITPEEATSLKSKLENTKNPREAHDFLWNMDRDGAQFAKNLENFSTRTQEQPISLQDPQQRAQFLQEQLQQVREDTGIPKQRVRGEDGKFKWEGGTVAVGATDIPGLQDQVFRGGSKEAGGPANKTFESPQDFGATKNHAEQNLGGQLDAKLQELIAQGKITPADLEGKSVFVHVDQEVCSVCRQGLSPTKSGTTVDPGVLSQMSQKYPGLTFEITNSNTGEVLTVKGGKIIQSTNSSPLNRAGVLADETTTVKPSSEIVKPEIKSTELDAPRQKLSQGEETISAYTTKELPPYGPERWKFLDDPTNWTPERQALHQELIEKAQGDAQQFADAAQMGDPTIYAMRGNTAAGKTRAIKGNIPELEEPVNATKDLRHRGVNPDDFKVDLREAQTDITLTSSQTHSESSTLAGKFEDTLRTIQTSDGAELGSILIDKRLARLEDVQTYAKMAEDTGRKLNVYDVDAPLEVSLAGVLERIPGGNDPLPPYQIIADGFRDIRTNRANVIEFYEDHPNLGKYELYGTLPDGSKVKVAEVINGSVEVFQKEMYLEITAKSGDDFSQMIANKKISSQLIESLTQSLSGERAAKVREILEPYIGQTWETALNAHSTKKTGK